MGSVGEGALDVYHAGNFVDVIRGKATTLNSPITEGHVSTTLCHLGNIAWRVGRTVKFDPTTYTFPGDDEANRYLTRPEYRAPWTLPSLAQL